MAVFTLVLEELIGSSIEDLAVEAVRISDLLKVNVEFRPNGCYMFVVPGTMPSNLIADYYKWMEGK